MPVAHLTCRRVLRASGRQSAHALRRYCRGICLRVRTVWFCVPAFAYTVRATHGLHVLVTWFRHAHDPPYQRMLRCIVCTDMLSVCLKIDAYGCGTTHTHIPLHTTHAVPPLHSPPAPPTAFLSRRAIPPPALPYARTHRAFAPAFFLSLRTTAYATRCGLATAASLVRVVSRGRLLFTIVGLLPRYKLNAVVDAAFTGLDYLGRADGSPAVPRVLCPCDWRSILRGRDWQTIRAFCCQRGARQPSLPVFRHCVCRHRRGSLPHTCCHARAFTRHLYARRRHGPTSVHTSPTTIAPFFWVRHAYRAFAPGLTSYYLVTKFSSTLRTTFAMLRTHRILPRTHACAPLLRVHTPPQVSTFVDHPHLPYPRGRPYTTAHAGYHTTSVLSSPLKATLCHALRAWCSLHGQKTLRGLAASRGLTACLHTTPPPRAPHAPPTPTPQPPLPHLPTAYRRTYAPAPPPHYTAAYLPLRRGAPPVGSWRVGGTGVRAHACHWLAELLHHLITYYCALYYQRA